MAARFSKREVRRAVRDYIAALVLSATDHTGWADERQDLFESDEAYAEGLAEIERIASRILPKP